MVDIRLRTPDGTVVDRASVTGHPYVVHFGYTHCPDICPTVLLALGLALDRLGSQADKLSVFFVTVDPERDRPEILADYVSFFDSRITALWGSRPEIDAFVRSFGASVSRNFLADGTYSVEHTPDLILVDSRGRVVARLDPFRPPEDLRLRLADLAGEN